MKSKLLIDCKILLEFIKARKDGVKESYDEFVKRYVEEMVKTRSCVSMHLDLNSSNIYKLTTLCRINGDYFENGRSYYLERPSGMLQDDVFKVIAHNREYFERYYSKYNKSVCELTNDALVSVFGFTQVDECDVKDRNVVELFFFKEYDMYFVNSPFFDRHSLWYEKGISEEMIIDIYDKVDSNISKRLKIGE